MSVKRIIAPILEKLVDSISRRFGIRLSSRSQYSPSQYALDFISEYGIHPEAAAVMPYANGLGLDIGCGGDKTIPSAIGVDIVPKGQKGQWGSQKGVVSEADVCASGDQLPFKSAAFDFVIARHNLEHYQDTIKALLEWHRVLNVGGMLCIVLPDDTEVDATHVDPTHKHVFTQESFRRLIEVLDGSEVIKIEVCVPHWSFLSVLKKNHVRSCLGKR